MTNPAGNLTSTANSGKLNGPVADNTVFLCWEDGTPIMAEDGSLFVWAFSTITSTLNSPPAAGAIVGRITG